MKKIVLLILIVFALSETANAKINKEYKDLIYDGCVYNAEQNNDFSKASKSFCGCLANYFDTNFTNEQMENWLRQNETYKSKYMMEKIIPKCAG